MLEIVTSDEAAIKHPNGATRRIGLRPEFRDRKNWKVVAFRADPSAPVGIRRLSTSSVRRRSSVWSFSPLRSKQAT